MKSKRKHYDKVYESAGNAQLALTNYRIYIADTTNADETIAQDLLTDCIHWYDVAGIDFDSALAMARQHADAERRGAP